jgi:proline racemase
MLDRRAYFMRHEDETRRLLTCEPRGHSAMSGAILQSPADPRADWGVLFIEVSGMLPMCGHGAIGVATVLAETGMIEVTGGSATARLDTPAGLVDAQIRVFPDSPTEVTLQNVASFVDVLDASVGLPDGREVAYDMAYGGNFYAIVDAEEIGLAVEPAAGQALIDAGLSLMAAINQSRRPTHPADGRIEGCKHVIFTAPGRDGADARNATVVYPGWLDRSPCGTGTSARMAQLHDRGELEIGQPFVNESVIGTRFTGHLRGQSALADRSAVLPEITGRAWITGLGQYVLDPTDPFPAGFEL